MREGDHCHHSGDICLILGNCCHTGITHVWGPMLISFIFVIMGWYSINNNTSIINGILLQHFHEPFWISPILYMRNRVSKKPSIQTRDYRANKWQSMDLSQLHLTLNSEPTPLYVWSLGSRPQPPIEFCTEFHFWHICSDYLPRSLLLKLTTDFWSQFLERKPCYCRFVCLLLQIHSHQHTIASLQLLQGLTVLMPKILKYLPEIGCIF
jgi:hypothetical protein